MNSVTAPSPALPRGMTLLFACACGIVIGNLYYSQPLLAAIAASFGRQPAELGYLVTLTQLGYAASLLVVVPLGDVVNRHTLIVRLLVANVVALVAVASSTRYGFFVAANMCVGFVTCSTQLLVPFAASLADDGARGRAIGTVMSGLLLGILLARVASGAIADWLGWRAVYAIAAAMVLLLAGVLAAKLPKDRRHARVDYAALMQSLAALVRDHFAILKVGPALTFALREALFALTYIEDALFDDASERSQLRDVIDAAMRERPEYWAPYYRGDALAQRIARQFSYSDRIRYYWLQPAVAAALARLFVNLARRAPPETLVAQWLPDVYAACRRGELAREPLAWVRHRIREVISRYARACAMQHNA